VNMAAIPTTTPPPPATPSSSSCYYYYSYLVSEGILLSEVFLRWPCDGRVLSLGWWWWWVV